MRSSGVLRRLAIAAGLASFVSLSGANAAFPDLMTEFDQQSALPLSPMAQELETVLQQAASTKTFRHKRDRAASKLFYEERGFQPVWVTGTELNTLALEVIEVLRAAEDEGLNPADYPVPPADFNATGTAALAELAAAEVQITESALMYAEDAQGGRISPKKISKNITQNPERPDPLDALRALAVSANPASVLAAYNPPHQGYRLLKEQLKVLRTGVPATEELVEIPTGKLLKLGVKGERVALLRQRLKVPSTPETEAVFDADLEAAVKKFQKDNGLNSDGVVGSRSLLALNSRITGNPIHDVIANMERWRWMPRDMGDLYIHVNVPEFLVRIRQEDFTLYEERVVVGKPANQTPVFSDNMDHVVVNPYWNVPYSIASKELLPEMRPNPIAYLAKGNYEVVAKGRIIDPQRVNWDAVTFKQLRIRQRPGRGNALGNIKFMFPNKHSVYLHDTPSKSLFKRSERAFSHGCVRVRNPMDFADALMSFQPKLNGRYIRSLVGKRETRVNLQTNFPIHITYFTAFVDDQGKLQRRPDIYGHNQKTIDALGLL
ncbi:peptidoglycan-binding protein [Rhodobacteraceae bacterium RKSG542]|uniref:L,D-transpeptidase family protein n=1 Tax=Pseudovibrio flavus TaxID=2529854 RepID=UPI0012BB4FDE|nr:L,D-transpeptidase family protein [Pseudovibrio flavus]MTI16544.1 peptidoglycan-binding protein [Pseudovibrio flavus]